MKYEPVPNNAQFLLEVLWGRPKARSFARSQIRKGLISLL